MTNIHLFRAYIQRIFINRRVLSKPFGLIKSNNRKIFSSFERFYDRFEKNDFDFIFPVIFFSWPFIYMTYLMLYNN